MSEIMEARNLLISVKNNNLRIKALMERRYDYYTMALRGRDFADNRTPGNRPGNRPGSGVEAAVIALQDLECEIGERIEDLIQLTRRTEALIDRIPDIKHRDLLKFRYYNNWSWNKVARAMNYERTQIWRIHNNALAAFAAELKVATSCNTVQHQSVL